MHREWLLENQKMIHAEAKSSRNHLISPVPRQLQARASAPCLSHCYVAVQTSRSWMSFPHGKQHHRISVQKWITGRDTEHTIPKECCTWQTLTPKHSHGPSTTHTSSSPGQMLHGFFQINAVCARNGKIGCFSHTAAYQLSGLLFIASLVYSHYSRVVSVVCLTPPWKEKNLHRPHHCDTIHKLQSCRLTE